MKVFLSWSGEPSLEIARLLKTYLPTILGNVPIFLSEHDIPSGMDWSQALAAKLKDSTLGIVCLTPHNLSSPWLLYEAGFLASRRHSTLCVLLLGELKPADVPSPLARFQSRNFNESGFRLLLQDIVKLLPAGSAPTPEQFNTTFDLCWPKMAVAHAAIQPRLAAGPRPPDMKTTFDREVLSLLLPDRLVSELQKLLIKVRDDCYALLRQRLVPQKIVKDRLRANIFLPDYKTNGNGHAFELFMHDKLRCGMNQPQEWSIRLMPGQGATATVFAECQQRIVERRDFELPGELLGAVHPDLKWIISSPIKDANGTALAVLNVDGVGLECDRDEVLQPLAELITQALGGIEGLFETCPRTTIRIQYGDLR